VKPSTTHRSGLEDKISEELKNAKIKAEYEKNRIKYSIPASEHTYTPDFVLPNGIIVEAKGIFDADDRRKHLLVREQHPNLEIRFVFSSPSTKIYPGSKTTVAEWCNKYGYKYATKLIPVEWLNEKKHYSTKGLEHI
jgi:hypothetical protein